MFHYSWVKQLCVAVQYGQIQVNNQGKVMPSCHLYDINFKQSINIFDHNLLLLLLILITLFCELFKLIVVQVIYSGAYFKCILGYKRWLCIDHKTLEVDNNRQDIQEIKRTLIKYERLNDREYNLTFFAFMNFRQIQLQPI
ncbi:unnamed protein product [Paramecium octaurelia]|uniref:Uncharacterized protein n=1 Tax=Paramecium octaurelia TaxID=43137 RepID=A0A8S1SJC4_PAROT|nr:unnamed protein product [Paramecium octaurelia]